MRLNLNQYHMLNDAIIVMSQISDGFADSDFSMEEHRQVFARAEEIITTGEGDEDAAWEALDTTCHGHRIGESLAKRLFPEKELNRG